jgi:hypothetical protein
MIKKPPITQRPLSYFEHNERKADPRAVHLDVLEWPEPIEVKEHKSNIALWNFRKAWTNRLKEFIK